MLKKEFPVQSIYKHKHNKLSDVENDECSLAKTESKFFEALATS